MRPASHPRLPPAARSVAPPRANGARRRSALSAQSSSVVASSWMACDGRWFNVTAPAANYASSSGTWCLMSIDTRWRQCHDDTHSDWHCLCRSTHVNSWLFHRRLAGGATTTPRDRTLACLPHVRSLARRWLLDRPRIFGQWRRTRGISTRTPRSGTNWKTVSGATVTTARRRRSPARTHCWTKLANRGPYDANGAYRLSFISRRLLCVII